METKHFISVVLSVGIIFQKGLLVYSSPYFHTFTGTDIWSGHVQPQSQVQNQGFVFAPAATSFFANNLARNVEEAENNNNSSLCKESNGQFADPKYCDKYYDCWEGRPVSSGQCSHGLMFNEQTSSCDYPAMVNCDGKEVNQPLQDVDKGCEQPYGTFADSRDCRKFTVCHAGRASYYTCDEGLAYDKESGLCAPPPEPLCLQGPPNDIPDGQDVPEVPLDPDTIKPAPPPSGPAGDGGSVFPVVPDWPRGAKCPIASTGFLPIVKDCRSVLVCINGSGYLLSCPPGTYYHANKASCLPEKNESCEQMRFTSSGANAKWHGEVQYAYFHPRYPLLPAREYQ